MFKKKDWQESAKTWEGIARSWETLATDHFKQSEKLQLALMALALTNPNLESLQKIAADLGELLKAADAIAVYPIKLSPIPTKVEFEYSTIKRLMDAVDLVSKNFSKDGQS